jgi:curved DNA-binding protein CbpA
VETFTDTIERAHRTLGLKAFAAPHEIKRAWRNRTRETHPDHGGSAAAFREVQTAVKILSAEGVREFYEEEVRRIAAAKRVATFSTSSPDARPTSVPRNPVRIPPRVHRNPALLAAAIFGFVFAPHFQELGLTWDPLPFHEFCEMMQSLDWVFFFAWWLVKRRTTPG